jgi:hypothetical protein
MSVKVHGIAYSKIFLHAAKNPSCSVGGYLIGALKGNEYDIVDAVPVCHGNPAGPIFEISADMVCRPKCPILFFSKMSLMVLNFVFRSIVFIFRLER